MELLLNGQSPDRVPFVPSVYEQGALIIGREPGPTSRNADLMAAAALKAYELYEHDIVTVGIDLYNIEAEAWGCKVSPGADGSIPGIQTHPLMNDPVLDPYKLAVPQVNDSNRLGIITEAARKVYNQIGDQVWAYACMGGPFSQAVELRGFEQLLMDMIESPRLVHQLLEQTTELSRQQALRLSNTGAGVYLYESWATMPLITPEIFRDYVVPYNRQVIDIIKNDFTTPPPAVIMGGNITLLIDFFVEANTSLIVVDFNADFDLIRAKTDGKNIIIRGCADPKLIERGDWDKLAETIDKLSEKSRGMNNFVWGCGCVTYNTSIENLLRFKDMCLNA